MGNNAYEIISVNSGLALDIKGGASAVQGDVLLQQWPWNGGTNQQFQMQQQSDGSYQIVVQNSGLCLDVVRQWQANGAPVQQWGCWGGPNQHWRLIPVR